MPLFDSDRVRDLLERAGLGELSPAKQRAVLLLAALVVAVGLWRFWPSAPSPEVAFDPGSGGAEAEAKAGAEETEAPAPDIVVHVVGAVARPGVYALGPGSRVADALEVAGGGLPDASLDTLNLARILCDGEQVYVLTVEQVESGTGPPTAAPATGQGTAGSAGGVVNINTATAAELEELPGVGPSTAQKIVDDREANGPFAAPEDLMRVTGIGPKKFESMREFVSCG